MDHETIVNLIAGTMTAKSLKVTVTYGQHRRKYRTGRKGTTEERKQHHLHPDKFHGEWNYVIKPRRKCQC
jgi:hypothetical protein